MINRYRRLSAVPVAAVCVLAIAACGSSSKSTSTGSAAGGFVHPVGLKITASQRSCLKQHGVTLPTGAFGGHGRGGAFPRGGKPPKGAKFPGHAKGAKSGYARGGFAHNSARSKALKACGVSLGSAPYGRPGGAGSTPAG